MWTIAFLALLAVNAVVISGSEVLIPAGEPRTEDIETILSASDEALLLWKPMAVVPATASEAGDSPDSGQLKIPAPPQIEPAPPDLESDYSELMGGYLERLSNYLGKFYHLKMVRLAEDESDE